MSDLRLDSHKLLFHPERVGKFLNGENIYPISLEVGLSSSCNHRCIFCALDYTGYKPFFIDKNVIINTLFDLQKKGLKSVVFSGAGEPFAHKDAVEIINQTKLNGIDVGISSNGALFSKEKSELCLGSITWIRFSIAGGTSDTYAKIHRTKKDDFDVALNNIKGAVRIKKENNLKTTLGAQLLLIPENVNEVYLLGELLKEVGIDYYTVKPYSQHPSSINKIDSTFGYSRLLELEEQLKTLENENFRIYFRANAMLNLYKKRQYEVCDGIHFFTDIDAKGNVIPCTMFVDNDEYRFGNIYESNIVDIWDNKNHIVSKLKKNGTENCREICRLHEINCYLDSLKNPIEHVNFI